jgi:hypothetical protein
MLASWNIHVFQSWPKGCFLLFGAAAVPVAKRLIEGLATKKPYSFHQAQSQILHSEAILMNT